MQGRGVSSNPFGMANGEKESSWYSEDPRLKYVLFMDMYEPHCYDTCKRLSHLLHRDFFFLFSFPREDADGKKRRTARWISFARNGNPTGEKATL